MTHTYSNYSKKKWYSGRICLFHYTAITTSKHCCCSQSLLFSYSYKLTQTYKLMKSETDQFSAPIQAEADFHIWNFWYINAFECISWLYPEWKLNWKKVFSSFLHLLRIFKLWKPTKCWLIETCMSADEHLLWQHWSLVVYFISVLWTV